jgi:hypothetical protein
MWSRPRGHKWLHNMAHTRCMWISKATCTYANTHAHAPGYQHARTYAHSCTHRPISNTYCFSTATKDSWTCLIVTSYVHCLSCWVLVWRRDNPERLGKPRSAFICIHGENRLAPFSAVWAATLRNGMASVQGKREVERYGWKQGFGNWGIRGGFGNGRCCVCLGDVGHVTCVAGTYRGSKWGSSKSGTVNLYKCEELKVLVNTSLEVYANGSAKSVLQQQRERWQEVDRCECVENRELCELRDFTEERRGRTVAPQERRSRFRFPVGNVRVIPSLGPLSVALRSTQPLT